MSGYRTIVADPPWEYDGFVRGGQNHRKRDGTKRTKAEQGDVTTIASPYPMMPLAAIRALPIDALAAPDCRLFLWATMRYLPDALALIASWGFSYRQTLVWDKTPFFNPLGGSVAPNACEFLIVAVRGRPARAGRWPTSVIRDARKARSTHSRKPDVFLDIAEAVSPGPYLELFARRQRLGWDTWGNEAHEHVRIGQLSEAPSHTSHDPRALAQAAPSGVGQAQPLAGIVTSRDGAGIVGNTTERQ